MTNQKKICGYSYFTGFATSLLIFLALSLFLAYRIGFSNLFIKLRNIIFPQISQAIYIPKNISDELNKLGAVIDNVKRLSSYPPHDTILVEPDERVEFKLRPNRDISAYMLKTIAPLNFDPPVVHIKKDSKLSPDLANYIKKESRLKYSYTTDKNGFRTTVPSVTSDEKILIIGDSVAFGVGVADRYTIASWLQERLGDRFEVINAGVGDYDGRRAFRLAKELGGSGRYSSLIYVACQNDFMWSSSYSDWAQEARDLLTCLKEISGNFNDNVVVFLHTYMEYCLRDIFREKGWQRDWIEKTDLLREKLPTICNELGLKYCDWTEIVGDFEKENKSIFSGFALYADHCHLSPLGNRLAAEKISSLIR